MTRQAKTAKPKTKFAKLYKCFKCSRPTNEFHTEQIDGKRHVVCQGGCRTHEG